ESQEICFVPDNDYAQFVERHAAPEQIRAGAVLDSSGNRLAEHAGVHRFTVGQRRGLGLATGERLYVREIRAGSGEVVVAPREYLDAPGLTANRVSLVDNSLATGAEVRVEVKIRYRHPAIPATMRVDSSRHAEVRFITSGPAVTPGQACVFYRGDEVLGGGFIERALER
ncbi:MAG TPA: aminomethyltransferase beta-barrel domain-containing protein, partial [Candidatus Dormibacteraeota bacterium]|nr:aminomethyltransferase beta-barrel domain-containing protein [Candidatus Dormibacteraeota bacterium]